MRKVTAEFAFRAHSRTRRAREKPHSEQSAKPPRRILTRRPCTHGWQRSTLRVTYCGPLELDNIDGG